MQETLQHYPNQSDLKPSDNTGKNSQEYVYRGNNIVEAGGSLF